MKSAMVAGMEAVMRKLDKTKAEKWKEKYSEWRKSGESQRAYCRRNGISFSTFGYWRKRFGESHDDSGFVRIERAALSIPTPAETTVRCNGVEVALTGKESEEFLGRLFRTLRQPVCS